jgi:hypothetical protein
MLFCTAITSMMMKFAGFAQYGIAVCTTGNTMSWMSSEQEQWIIAMLVINNIIHWIKFEILTNKINKLEEKERKS